MINPKFKITPRMMRRTVYLIEKEYMELMNTNHKKQRYYLNNRLTKWKKRSPGTIKQYKRQGYYTKRIGVRTGAMERSWNTKKRSRLINGKIIIYNNQDYSKYFDNGTNHIPERPLHTLNQRTQKKYINIFSDELAKDLGFTKIR